MDIKGAQKDKKTKKSNCFANFYNKFLRKQQNDDKTNDDKINSYLSLSNETDADAINFINQLQLRYSPVNHSTVDDGNLLNLRLLPAPCHWGAHPGDCCGRWAEHLLTYQGVPDSKIVQPVQDFHRIRNNTKTNFSKDTARARSPMSRDRSFEQNYQRPIAIHNDSSQLSVENLLFYKKVNISLPIFRKSNW